MNSRPTAAAVGIGRLRQRSRPSASIPSSCRRASGESAILICEPWLPGVCCSTSTASIALGHDANVGKSRDRQDRRRRRRRHGGDPGMPPRDSPEPPDRADPPGLDRFVIEEPRQVFGKLGGRQVAVGRPLRQRLEHDGFQVARHPRVDGAGRRRLVSGRFARSARPPIDRQTAAGASAARRAWPPGCRRRSDRRSSRSGPAPGLMYRGVPSRLSW